MVVLMAIAVAIRVRVPLRPTRKGAVLSMSPNLLMLVLFYSLAVHMYQSLGDWPASIGGEGFSPLLIAHAGIATNYLVILLLLTVFIWPVTLLLCALVRRWRGLVSYLGIYGLSYAVSCGLMLLAPSGFLNWWWD